jgi:hypothetical protein
MLLGQRMGIFLETFLSTKKRKGRENLEDGVLGKFATTNLGCGGFWKHFGVM